MNSLQTHTHVETPLFVSLFHTLPVSGRQSFFPSWCGHIVGSFSILISKFQWEFEGTVWSLDITWAADLGRAWATLLARRNDRIDDMLMRAVKWMCVTLTAVLSEWDFACEKMDAALTEVISALQEILVDCPVVLSLSTNRRNRRTWKFRSHGWRLFTCGAAGT